MRISNVNATANLGCNVDPGLVCQSFLNSEVSGAGPLAHITRIRLKNPRCFATVSKMGKLTVVGARSVEDARRALKKVARRLRVVLPGGGSLRFIDFRVKYMSGNHELGFPLNLLAMSNRFRGGGSTFALEGGGIPCVKVPIRDIGAFESDVVVSVHSSGKLKFLNAKSEEDLTKALEVIRPVVVEFQCETLDSVDPEKPISQRARKRAPKMPSVAVSVPAEDRALLDAASDYDSEGGFGSDTSDKE